MIKIKAFIVILFSLFLMNGCGKKEEIKSVELKGGIKGGGTFRINELENVRSLDPVGINDNVSHHVAHQIYDLLIDLDSSLQLVPELAKSWEISEDGLLYTFHLRKGAYFQDNACFSKRKRKRIYSC